MELKASPSRRALAGFQDAFAHALFAGLDGAHDLSPELACLVAQPGFAVYRNTVVKGCIDALGANYPAVLALCGEEAFRAAAVGHLRAHPPATPVLLEYGANFADFLSTLAPGEPAPPLADVARLDRFWTEAHLAPDAAPLLPDALAGLDQEVLGAVALRPHPSARWAWFEGRPIVTLWRRAREAAAGGSAVDGEAVGESPGEGVLIVRPHDAVESVDLDAAGCAFLDACARGAVLLDAALAALEASPQADLSALLSKLLRAGALVRPDTRAPITGGDPS